MKREGVLLLGGAGFIGSALAKRLQLERRPVHVVGRRGIAQLEQLLPQCGTVVHLASSTTPGSSAAQPSLELDNVSLTLRLLDLLQKQSQTHLIYFSSGGTVYGNPTRLPVAEDSPLAPLSYHGAGKAAQEAFCQALRSQGHAVTILRPANAYGPGQALRGGFGLVRTLLEHARAGTSVEVWGDGENIRDYIYIDDVVEACQCLIDLPQHCGTYNLGSGTGYSVNQVRSLVEDITGVRLTPFWRPARGADVRAVVLNNERLCQVLNSRPKVDLREGVSKTWAWLQEAR